MKRCWWSGTDPLYVDYHDHEWGRPVLDDAGLFEKLCLEGFQAGLSWITILRKRGDFRRCFHGFDLERVAAMGPADVERLLQDASIVRHRGKIESAIGNAHRALELREEFGSIATYVLALCPDVIAERPRVERGQIPATTPDSTALSKDFRKRGWRFVGPTTVYAFMQAMGLVNDHLWDCGLRDEVEAERIAAYGQRG